MKNRIRDEIKKAGFWFWFWSILFTFVVLLYLTQPTWAFALTVYSPWVPGLLGLVGAVLTCVKRSLRAVAAVALLWVIWGFVASEEFHSLVRRTPGDADFRSFRYEGARLRVISLNCAGGTIEAAEAVKTWEPDVVLLQESPGKSELAALAKEMYGNKASIVVGPDSAILSRYRLTSWHKGKVEPVNYVGATATVGPGETWQIVSLRLQPPVLRFDYWSPECWGAYAEGKRQHVEELKALWNDVTKFATAGSIVLGGDFNTPPDRAVRAVLEPRLVDSGRVAGSGWGMTAVASLPLVRIDQIWLDTRFVPLRTISVHNNRSDHRMVVCDFQSPSRDLKGPNGS